MRAFVAIDTPPEVLEELLDLQKQLPKTVSLTHGFHLTLKFLGEITPAKAEAAKERLKAVKFRPFSARLSSVGVFPAENYIRVIWTGVEPEAEFISLQHSIDKELELEFPKQKNFKPHLTLARVKSAQPNLQRLDVKPIRFEVNEFKLKKSVLSAKRPVYEDLAVFAKSL